MRFEKGFSIKIAENRCLNQTHHAVECNHCIENCPSKAILLHEHSVYLNKDLCCGCGLCFNDCPTQVFSSSLWDETSIVEEVEEQKWKATEFFCGKHSSPFNKDKTWEMGAVQLPACLSMISKGAWYEFGLKTAIELHLDQCEGCSMSRTLSRLDFNVGTAAEWLEASGCTPEINYIHQSSKGKTKKNLKAIETGLKVTSRRDLFLSVIGKGRQISENIRNNTKSFSKERDQERRNSYLPDWQKRLAEVYPNNRIKGASPAYWPTIKINDKCVNCGMCTNFCPSKTLKNTVEGGICTRYFTSGLCLDCRICQLFCPREAISRDREKVEKPFEATTLFSAAAIKCRRCTSITFDNTRHLCYWCREETAIDDEIKEKYRKLLL
ncbi:MULTISPECIES: 4Fe-4S binding protein [unclassified Dehalobacter]|uniref:4Fe-4S binding protein n=1 Tax=unclassified Dehalobacter TaxID=2635733 RepID=UPI000E6BDB81|nr:MULTISPECIES: 4Fe-4S binding protein [unclassified Dehalobacter]RJE47150.1 (4Fe-4S)-binding protein [Dehalobacter sp. MCB1]TCX53688.1 (4Fe-4S)-binding protein [Dehalobacter sp. 14DCB1]TCX54991.1 (4Fe-4S)-binding protein [Dehalobacter sp. 12DCB1]